MGEMRREMREMKMIMRDEDATGYQGGATSPAPAFRSVQYPSVHSMMNHVRHLRSVPS